MALRLRTTFHSAGRPRSMAELAGVVAMLAWKLALEAIKRMRKADYDIDVGQPYFNFISEYVIFLAQAADRIAFRELAAEDRIAFTTAMARKLADAVEDNSRTLLVAAKPGESAQSFLDLFNRRGADYAEFDYGPDGPDFGFKRYFAACLREGLPKKDQLWVVDQAMDIEAPEALKLLEKNLAALFHPAPAKK